MNIHHTVTKKERKIATDRWREDHVPDSIDAGLNCNCNEKSYPHPAHQDETGIFDYHRSLRDAIPR